ncbi:hypothetical protein KSP39_PZI022365 [Platanthera zijinensis]|uniref:Carotenoid cleavage dioxygenase 8 n=1 Tax=Platanthera zijinensis TaxID=2320716 RepID=A0AAP0FU87_9ASPA
MDLLLCAAVRARATTIDGLASGFADGVEGWEDQEKEEKGTYLRNGPGLWHISDYHFRHLFDGYATLVSLHFEDGRLTAAHRQVESDAYKAAKEKKRLCYREFSEVPISDGFLSYIGGLAGLLSGASLTDNANTGVVQLGDGRVVCLTETVKGSIQVDPETLDTVGRFEYADELGGLIHSAHPIVTETEFLTLLPDLVRPGYKVVRMEVGTNERKVIGRVECRGGMAPGWVHSFPVTENYVVVPEMPLRYCAKNLLRAEPTPLYKFEWRPEWGSYMHVMCKATGTLVASVEVPPFVTFHFINAYEEEDEEGRVSAIVADCCEHYADPSILDKLRLQNLRSSIGLDVLPDARVGRFRIPLDGSSVGSLVCALDPEKHGRGMDMCSINRRHLGRPYRYAYACGAQRPCNFPNTLTKVKLSFVNAHLRNFIHFYRFNSCVYDCRHLASDTGGFAGVRRTRWGLSGGDRAGPPSMALPLSSSLGVVISMVSGKDGEGYALILDGSSFEEIARAKFPYALPYGLHGCWVQNVAGRGLPRLVQDLEVRPWLKQGWTGFLERDGIGRGFPDGNNDGRRGRGGEDGRHWPLQALGKEAINQQNWMRIGIDR